VVLACNVLGSLVREAILSSPNAAAEYSHGNNNEPLAHDVLAEMGAMDVLQAHVHVPYCSNKVRA